MTGSGRDQQFITRHGPGRFLGELNLLTGLRVFVTARVARAGEVLAVPAAQLRHIVATQPGLSDVILAAFIARRSELLDVAGGSIRVIGSRFSPETARIREFLSRSRIPYSWLDPERDADVERVLMEFDVEPHDLPVVIAVGSVLGAPTVGELAEFLGITLANLPDRCVDLVVVGGGPAGLAASVYGSSEGLSTLGVEAIAVGGQAGSSSRIENYLGFPTGISGGDLTQRALVKRRSSAPCSPARARRPDFESSPANDRPACRRHRRRRPCGHRGQRQPARLKASRLDEFECKGVYYAATETEVRQCAPAPVVVAGAGNSAGQAALFLAESGSPVTIVIRRPHLAASMSRYLVNRIIEHPRIGVRPSASVAALDGGEVLGRFVLAGPDGNSVVPCSALFSFIGADPSSAWLSQCAALDDHGFVLTDPALTNEHLDARWTALGRGPLPFETSHPGLFAVGEVRSGSTKRVAAAVGEGSSAVRSVQEHLAFTH